MFGFKIWGTYFSNNVRVREDKKYGVYRLILQGNTSGIK